MGLSRYLVVSELFCLAVGRGSSRELAGMARPERLGRYAGNRPARALECLGERSLESAAAGSWQFIADCVARPGLYYSGD